MKETLVLRIKLIILENKTRYSPELVTMLLLKEQRVKLNIPQKELAEKLGVDQAVYSRLEGGKAQLTVNRLFEIASILNFPLSDFIQVIGQTYDELKDEI